MSQEEKDTAARAEADTVSDEGAVLSWRCHPVKRRPVVSMSVTAFIVLVGLLVYFATDSRGFTVLALVILFASLAKFFFPTEYRLSDKNIKVKTTTQTLVKDWSMYRSCYADKNGILLSPFTRPSRLENFRGLYIMFEKNRDEVTAFVKERIDKGTPPALESKKDDETKNSDSAGEQG